MENISIEEMQAMFAASVPDTSRRVHDGKRVAQQGDVYIHPVPADHPHGPETTDRQLAAGDTKGSRHVITGSVRIFAGTTLPHGVASTMPIGPSFIVAESAVLEHPEHAEWSFGPGAYQVTYQLNALTGRAVED